MRLYRVWVRKEEGEEGGPGIGWGVFARLVAAPGPGSAKLRVVRVARANGWKDQNWWHAELLEAERVHMEDNISTDTFIRSDGG